MGGPHHLCYTSDYYVFSVVNSPQDGSCVLKHQGGTEDGGGNGDAYFPGLAFTDVVVQADVRNVQALHSSAKSQGLTARVNAATGTQYALWYAVEGTVQLMKTSNWICSLLTSATSTAWPEGERRTLKLSVIGNVIRVYSNGTLL